MLAGENWLLVKALPWDRMPVLFTPNSGLAETFAGLSA
jgi:hypothetical protein